jgi:hypothetical protein
MSLQRRPSHWRRPTPLPKRRSCSAKRSCGKSMRGSWPISRCGGGCDVNTAASARSCRCCDTRLKPQVRLQAKHGSNVIYRLLRLAHTAAALSFVAWWWSRPAITGGCCLSLMSHLRFRVQVAKEGDITLCLVMQACSSGCCGPWTMRCRCCQAGGSSVEGPAAVGGVAAPPLESSARRPGRGSAWRPAHELRALCRL